VARLANATCKKLEQMTEHLHFPRPSDAAPAAVLVTS
jgi:hypothetical protein